MAPPPTHTWPILGPHRRETGWWQKCHNSPSIQGVPKAPQTKADAGGPMGVAQPDRGPPRGSLGAQ